MAKERQGKSKATSGKKEYSEKKSFQGKKSVDGKRPVYKKKSTTKPKSSSNPDEVRLNKYISNSGVCSRREADMHISIGSVTVNGKVVTEMGYKVKMVHLENQSYAVDYPEDIKIVEKKL